MRVPIFVALMTLLPGLSWAAEPLTGTWVLDREAGDDLQPVLKAQGVPWAQRKMAASLDVTQKLVDHGDRVEVHVITSMKTKDSELILDRTPRVETGDQGEAKVLSYRDADGSVVTQAEMDGKRIEVRRTLAEGGQVLRQRISAQAGDKPAVSATLVYRRQ